MNKLIYTVVLLFTFGFSKPVATDTSLSFNNMIKYTDSITLIPHVEITLDSPLTLWNYGTNTTQIKLIVKFIILGNGAIELPKNQDSLINNMIEVRHCVDNNWKGVSEAFIKDVDIFSAIMECSYKEGWM